MIYAALLAFGVLFLELFLFLRMASTAKSIIDDSRESLGVILSSELDDDAKEALVRRSSVAMFKLTGFFILKFGVIAAALYLLYFSIDLASPELGGELLESFVSLRYIVMLTLATMAYAWLRNVVVKQLQSG